MRSLRSMERRVPVQVVQLALAEALRRQSPPRCIERSRDRGRDHCAGRSAALTRGERCCRAQSRSFVQRRSTPCWYCQSRKAPSTRVSSEPFAASSNPWLGTYTLAAQSCAMVLLRMHKLSPCCRNVTITSIRQNTRDAVQLAVESCLKRSLCGCQFRLTACLCSLRANRVQKNSCRNNRSSRRSSSSTSSSSSRSGSSRAS